MTAATPEPSGALVPVRRLSRSGFAGRLLVAQAMVLGAGALTIWIVASLAAPRIFKNHMEQARVAHTAAEARHVDEAFGAALLISISLALLAAVAAALAVTWYLTRRVQYSIDTVAAAATGIAAGRYDARVPDPGLGSEFATLAATYNQLAERLQATEATRRRILADLAHEMRTPLATIDAHLEAIEDGVRDPDADTLQILRSSTRRLGRLAEDIGAVSNAEEGRLEIHRLPVQAFTVAETAAAGAQARYSAKHVGLHLATLTRRSILVDPDRIAQVVANLLDNALRHTPPDGNVTLTCRDENEWVVFMVSDTGEGIAPDHLSHVFDRFYRADSARDREHGGSGIGLSIAKALVEAHEGRISADSAGPGHGSTFTVRLLAN